tara:strand:+ start:1282 stop:2841 length:1560 start_codon:yes stop_codon:yes gene_type:complete
MKKINCDLLIIGAGATGSCLAFEAIQRGLKVALLDEGDISGGTSCRSTKLLHGGVRYLELAFKTLDIGQLNLVKEALEERSYWLEKAPLLTSPIELLLPTKNCFSRAYYQTGLKIYDILSKKKNINNSRLIDSIDIKQYHPYINDIFNGGVVYSDGQFNDSKLCLLLAITAEKGGAIVRNYCKVIEFKHDENGVIYGAKSEDNKGNKEFWEASVIVNATGINSDKIRKMASPIVEERIIPSRGTHLIIKESLCPKNIGLINPSTLDGRVIFVLPFHKSTLIGTTDVACKTENATKPSIEEEEYLLENIKILFPNLNSITKSACWAGARPLLKSTDNTKGTSKLLREHEIEVLPSGLISAMGGKWTTCRKIALDTLLEVEKLLNKRLPLINEIELYGMPKDFFKDINSIDSLKQDLRTNLPSSKLRENQIRHLIKNYGTNSRKILSETEKLMPLNSIIPICESEINYLIENEHAKTVTDILARRCRIAMIDINEANKLTPIVNKCLKIHGFEESSLDLSF